MPMTQAREYGGGEAFSAVRALDPFTSTAAPANRAILDAMRRAREDFQPDPTEADLAELLRRTGPAGRELADADTAVLDALHRLEDAGLVIHEQNTTLTTLHDVRRRRHRWRLTDLGRVALDAVDTVLASHIRPGELQLTALRDMRGELHDLVVQQGRAADATKASIDRLLSAQHRFVDEAERFIDTLLTPAEAAADEDEAFEMRKDAIREYLRRFLHELDDLLPAIRTDLRALVLDSLDDRLGVAEASADLYEGNRTDWSARAREQVLALADYYGTPSVGIGPPGRVDRLYDAARHHIVGLTRTLSRLSKVTFGADRFPDRFLAAARLVHTDVRHSPEQIIGALTGLGVPAHVQVPRDQDPAAQALSWPEGEPVRVSVALRTANRTHTQGRTAAAPDPTLTRQRIRRERAGRRAAARQEAARLIAQRHFALAELTDLTHGEFRTALLTCLTAAISSRPGPGGLRTGRTSDGSALDVVLRDPTDPTDIATLEVQDHRFTCPNFTVTITPADTQADQDRADAG